MKKNRVNRQDKQRKEQMARLEHLSRRDFLIDAIKTGAAAMSIPAMVSALLTESVALGATQYGLSVPMFQYHANGGPLSAGIGPMGVAAAGSGRSVTALGPMAEQAYGFDAGTLTLRAAFGTKFVDFAPRPILVTPAVLNAAGAVVTPAVFNTTTSGFIASFLSQIPDVLNQAKVMAVKFVVDSQDDNNTNLCGITKVYEASGLFKPPSLLESAAFRNTETGMDNSSPFDLKIPPYVVQLASDIPGQKSFSSAMPSVAQVDRDRIGFMAQAANNLTNRHLAKALTGSSDRAKNSLSDAVSQTMAYVNPVGAIIDAKTDTNLAANFGLTAATTNNDPDYRLAMSLAYMFNFQSGQRDIHSVVESNGGYDYHGNMATSTQAKDAALGLRLGKIARAAIEAGKDLIMIVTADGAVSANSDPLSPIIATGDRGILGSYTMYLVHGDPTTTYTHDLVQVGKINADGRVALDVTGKNDMSAAIAMAANVLHLNGVSDDDIMAALGSQISSKAQMLASRAIIKG